MSGLLGVSVKPKVPPVFTLILNQRLLVSVIPQLFAELSSWIPEPEDVRPE